MERTPDGYHGLIELANRRSYGVKPTMVFVTVAFARKKLSADWWKFSDQHRGVGCARMKQFPHRPVPADWPAGADACRAVDIAS